MATPEGRVKLKVRECLKAANAWSFAPIIMGPLGRHGIPDILACVPVTVTEEMVGKTLGVFVAVETKAPGKLKNTTPNQRKELKEIHEASGVALVVDRKDEVIEAVDDLVNHGNISYRVIE